MRVTRLQVLEISWYVLTTIEKMKRATFALTVHLPLHLPMSWSRNSFYRRYVEKSWIKGERDAWKRTNGLNQTIPYCGFKVF